MASSIPATDATTAPNAAAFSPRPIAPGVWAPLPTFFLPNTQDLDIPTFKKHVLRIAKAGVGLVIAGSMGEAHHLEPQERIQLIKAARNALDTASPPLSHVPIIAGTGGSSTRQTIALTRDAYEAGADYAIVIMSGFFSWAFNDRNQLKGYFSDVAKASALPVIIYNFPAAAGGIDLESDLIEELAAEHANIVGVKLTCGNVGKLTRIAATTTDPEWIKAHPRSVDTPFLTLGGFTDFVVPSVYAGAHGAITGLANVAPYSAALLHSLAFASSPLFPPSPNYTSINTLPAVPASLTGPSLLKEAARLQGIIAHGDRTVAKAGINGTKLLLQHLHGKDAFPEGSEVPRKPLTRTSDESLATLLAHPDVVALLHEEKIARQRFESKTEGQEFVKANGEEVATQLVQTPAVPEPEKGTVLEKSGGLLSSIKGALAGVTGSEQTKPVDVAA